VADDRQLAAAHDARGQERELISDAVNDEGVAGVMPALEAHDDVGLLGEPVDDLALALVAPLRPDDHHVGHYALSSRASLRTLAPDESGQVHLRIKDAGGRGKRTKPPGDSRTAL